MKIILIGGASGCIGSYLMNYFSNQGFIVYGIGRKLVDFENKNCFYTSLDIQNENAVQEYFSHFRKNKIKIDCYIHCIGSEVSIPIGFLSRNNLNDLFSYELSTSIMFVKEILSLMVLNKSGILLNYSSIVVSMANQGSSLYGINKIAMEYFFRVLADEYNRFGIKSITLRLPIIEDTEMAKKLLPSVREKLQTQKQFYLTDVALSSLDIVLQNRVINSGEIIELW